MSVRERERESVCVCGKGWVFKERLGSCQIQGYPQNYIKFSVETDMCYSVTTCM